jgi:ubiquinone/menaquinone biosynthesis C-methylase UbiE
MAAGRRIGYDQAVIPSPGFQRTNPMKRSRWLIAFVCVSLATAAAVRSEEPKPKPPEKPKYEFRKEHDPDGIGKFYQGREIAQVMGHQAAGWLDRPEREKEENPAKLMEALNVQPGDKVADIGAGTGYHTFRLSDKVGAKGKVYAVEIQQEMLDIIDKRMKERGVKNIELVLGKEDDPKLPDGTLDMILMVDVYHEFSYPWEMTEAMVKALKPGGRLVFVEFRLEDPKVPIKLVHKMTEKQVLKEMEAHPLRHVKTHHTLPWQHIIVFEKKAGPDKEEKPK